MVWATLLRRARALESWELGHVPAASERLHQQHAGVYATAKNVDLVALGSQGSRSAR